MRIFGCGDEDFALLVISLGLVAALRTSRGTDWGIRKDYRLSAILGCMMLHPAFFDI